MEVSTQERWPLSWEHKNKASLVQYNIQQLDCSKVDCTKFAVIAIVNPYGDLFAYCRIHGRERTLEILQ